MPVQKPEISSWGDFATPIFSSRYPQPELLNTALKKFILDQEAQGERFRNPDYIPSNQVQIFESSFDLFKDPDRAIQELKMFFMHGILHAVAETNGYSVDRIDSSRLRRLLLISSHR